MKKKDIWIQKASGDRVPFSLDKLRSSLERSGASEEAIALILPQVEEMLHEKVTTREVYKMAYKMLKADSKHAAGRYKLKDALLELGPSGFPFEKFVGELLRLQGFKIEVGVPVEGRCVTHEVDVIAVQNHTRIMVECKYHNKRGVNTDVKIPLYVHARFQDIYQKMETELAHRGEQFHGWLVTNTRFSDDAAQYGSCCGLELLGWDYPQGRGLRELIVETGAHPITCMSTLASDEKRHLLEKNIVLCRELADHARELHQMGLSKARIQKILQEGTQICN
jgi:Restriction endonuclease